MRVPKTIQMLGQMLGKRKKIRIAGMSAGLSPDGASPYRILVTNRLDKRRFSGQKQPLQKPRGILETALATAVFAQHRTHLHVEIGIMLGGRPDGEDEVVGIALL